MGKVMRFQAGAVAIYSDPTPATPSTAPLTDPLNNLGVLEFHSNLFYPKIVGTYTGGGTIPALASNARSQSSLVTIAHGLGASPLALGTMVVGGNTYSLNGTVIVPGGAIVVDGTGTGTYSTSPAFITLSADGTNVYLDCTLPGSSGTRSAQALTYEIHILDLLDTQTVAPTGDVTAPQMELSPTRITMGRRKFDTNDKHIRSSSTGNDVMISGESILSIGAGVPGATASTPNGSHEGTMGMVQTNLGLKTIFARNNSSPTYPTPTATQMQFP